MNYPKNVSISTKLRITSSSANEFSYGGLGLTKNKLSGPDGHLFIVAYLYVLVILKTTANKIMQKLLSFRRKQSIRQYKK